MVVASPDKANWDKNLFAYCDNNPISRKDDGGFSSGPDNFWPATNKGQDVNYAEMAIDAAVGALTNLAAASRASVYTNSCKSGSPASVCRETRKSYQVMPGRDSRHDLMYGRLQAFFDKLYFIPKPVKKLEKLFIAPKVRQVLYETSQRVFTRCACAQRTGFLIKFFNQESVLSITLIRMG